MTGEVEVEVGVEEEVKIGVWRPPVGAGVGAATGVSEPILPVRVLMNKNMSQCLSGSGCSKDQENYD